MASARSSPTPASPGHGPLRWSRADARRFLAALHFTRADLPAVIDRLGSVQYDPLRPLGRNHDLVLQARVPGYRVDDWHDAAYRQRLVYDAWDKQACLVPRSDWRYRRVYHEYFRSAWEKRVLGSHADAVEATLTELRRRGPLSSLDFEDQTRVEAWSGSWYGPKLVKQILRALWDTGQVVTHHRDGGRHVYAVPERVIAEEELCAPAPSRRDSLRFLILRRHQSAGLLRLSADAGLWSLPASAAERRSLVDELVAEGELTPVDVEGDRYHLRTADLSWAEAAPPEPRMTFVAPLDSLMWDRKALARIFGFDYVWEVYKPESERRWGYYVLPVFYRDAFVARFDGRLVGGVWKLERWWWEPDVKVDDEMLGAFSAAVRGFTHYLGARRVSLGRRMPVATRRPLAQALAGDDR
ncbi:MAG: crosslink repair DNA glycosylase YcaQ family protein [Trueperaceae bacterium]